MEHIYEQFFFLKYWGGWSLSEAYNLPIGLRDWFVKRLMRQLEDEKEAMDNGSRGSSGNSQTLSAQNQPSPPPHMMEMNKQDKS